MTKHSNNNVNYLIMTMLSIAKDLNTLGWVAFRTQLFVSVYLDDDVAKNTLNMRYDYT